MQLRIGDFLCGSDWAIERKAHADLVQSVRGGRLVFQLERQQLNFSRHFLCCGLDGPELSSGALLMGFAQKFDRLCVLQVPASLQADAIACIATVAGPTEESRPGGVEVGNDILRQALVAIPFVTSKTRVQLLQKFKSLFELVTANPSDMAEFGPVGRKLLELFDFK